MPGTTMDDVATVTELPVELVPQPEPVRAILLRIGGAAAGIVFGLFVLLGATALDSAQRANGQVQVATENDLFALAGIALVVCSGLSLRADANRSRVAAKILAAGMLLAGFIA